MKRQMYELIIPDNQLPIFHVNINEKILRHISHPKAVADAYRDISCYHWSVKNGWVTQKMKYDTNRIHFPLVSINADELIPFIKNQILDLEEHQGEIDGNYIIAHRRVGNIIHVGTAIYDATTERPVHWLD